MIFRVRAEEYTKAIAFIFRLPQTRIKQQNSILAKICSLTVSKHYLLERRN